MAKPSKPRNEPAAVTLARRLRDALAGDDGYVADAVHEQPGGLVEANALFDVRSEGGAVLRVRVIRTH
jgi:hypothetical protein